MPQWKQATFFTLLIFFSPTVLAMSIQPYLQGFTGADFVPDLKATAPAENNPSNTSNVRKTNRVGYSAGGAVGVALNPVHVETELKYLHADVNNFIEDGNKPLNGNVTGYTSGTLLLGNLYYEFRSSVWGIRPYIGAGLGEALAVRENFQNKTNSLKVFDKTHDMFAYQGIIGAAYPLNDNLQAGIDYRYVATNASKIRFIAGNGGTARTMQDSFANHTLNLVFIYNIPIADFID